MLNQDSTFAEPYTFAKFRTLLDSSPLTFKVKNQIVTTDSMLSRDLLGYKPNIFQEAALLGSSTPGGREDRKVIRAWSEDLVHKVSLEKICENLEKSTRENSCPDAFVIASLDSFGPYLMGKKYWEARRNVIDFSLSRINQQFFKYRPKKRKKIADDFLSQISHQLVRLDDNYSLGHQLLLSGRTNEDVARLILAAYMSISGSPGISASWLAYECSPVGKSSLEDIREIDSRLLTMEILRLRPAAWTHGRTAKKRGMMGNFPVEIGDEVLSPIGYIQTSNQYWENPLSFKPHRWETISPKNAAYFPFGFGKRSCVGNELGIHFLKATHIFLCHRNIKISRPRGAFRIGPLYGPQNFAVSQ